MERRTLLVSVGVVRVVVAKVVVWAVEMDRLEAEATELRMPTNRS